MSEQEGTLIVCTSGIWSQVLKAMRTARSVMVSDGGIGPNLLPSTTASVVITPMLTDVVLLCVSVLNALST